MGILKAIRGTHKGSSLVETLVAFGLISLIITVSTGICTSINSGSATFARIKALEIAEQELSLFSFQNYLTDEIKQSGNYTVQKKISRSIDFPDCIRIEIRVFLTGKILCRLEKAHFIK